jgi:outer membrane protein W
MLNKKMNTIGENIMKKLMGSLLAVVLFATIASAQVTKAGKIGIGVDGVTSPNLTAKYFFNENIASELTVGANIYSPGGDATTGYTKVTGSDVRVGLSLLYHFTGNEFVPYLGVEGLYETNKEGGFYTKEPDAKNDVVVSAVFGGEYFIAKQFSLGVKEKVGFDFGLSRDIPKEDSDMHIGTSTLVTAKFYFN